MLKALEVLSEKKEAITVKTLFNSDITLIAAIAI
jgi:hypothetical protein